MFNLTRKDLKEMFDRISNQDSNNAMLYGERIGDMDDRKFLWAFEKTLTMFYGDAIWKREENDRIFDMWEKSLK